LTRRRLERPSIDTASVQQIRETNVISILKMFMENPAG